MMSAMMSAKIPAKTSAMSAANARDNVHRLDVRRKNPPQTPADVGSYLV